MNTPPRKLAANGQFAQTRYADPALQAATVRAMIWEKLQNDQSSELLKSTTLEELRRSITRGVSASLGLNEREMIRLLKRHGTH